jgi:hypothetical protein
VRTHRGHHGALALADKYDRLVELRRRRERGEPIPQREVFAELSRRFPGCLQELERLPLDELEERARACHEAAAGGEAPPWMQWLTSYHALLRCAFAVRAALGPTRSSVRAAALAACDLGALADELGAREHLVLDRALLVRLALPESGRTVDAVLEELATRFATDRSTIELALLPARRRP